MPFSLPERSQYGNSHAKGKQRHTDEYEFTTGYTPGAAPDTVHHKILLKRLEATFGIKDAPLSCFVSYLTNRSQRVTIEQCQSE